MLVNLSVTGPVLLAGDAIPLAGCVDPDRRPILPFDLHADAVRESTRRLIRMAAAEKATVIFGHDAQQWARLRTGLDDYYD